MLHFLISKGRAVQWIYTGAFLYLVHCMRTKIGNQYNNLLLIIQFENLTLFLKIFEWNDKKSNILIRTSKKDIFFDNCSKCVILSFQRILYFWDSDFCILDISTNFESQTSSSLILYFGISTNFVFLTSPPILYFWHLH